MDRNIDISVRRYRSTNYRKKRKYVSPDNQPLTENTWVEEDVHISAWDLKRQYKVCNFELKAEIHWSLNQTCQLRRVCSPAVALLHKMSPRHRRKICANSLWLHSYVTQTSPSKNKDINYIFTYLRVLRCLSSGSIYIFFFNCKTISKAFM